MKNKEKLSLVQIAFLQVLIPIGMIMLVIHFSPPLFSEDEVFFKYQREVDIMTYVFLALLTIFGIYGLKVSIKNLRMGMKKASITNIVILLTSLIDLAPALSLIYSLIFYRHY